MTEPCNLAKNLSKSFADLYSQVTELTSRIFQLEEKERQRAREDHDREISLDIPETQGC